MDLNTLAYSRNAHARSKKVHSIHKMRLQQAVPVGSGELEASIWYRALQATKFEAEMTSKPRL